MSPVKHIFPSNAFFSNPAVGSLRICCLYCSSGMKKFAAWAFLVIYLNAAAQALLPWVSDVLAHAFNWEDHLEHVHNGMVHSHHVGLEMAAEQDDSTSAAHTFLFHKDALSAHLLPLPPAVWGVTQPVPAALYADWPFHYQNVAGDVLFPPPDVL